MITLPVCSWPVRDFSCCDVVFFSQSKTTIISLNTLQKSLHTLQNAYATRNQAVGERPVSILDSYLHFEFSGVKNFQAWTNFIQAKVSIANGVTKRGSTEVLPFASLQLSTSMTKVFIILLQVWICYLLVFFKYYFNFIWKRLCLYTLLDLLAL